MNRLNALDMVKLLDEAARRSQGGLHLFFCRRDRADDVLRDLCELGWTITRSRREATLDGRTIRVMVADRFDGGKGCAIAGYMSDTDVALTPLQEMCLKPNMLGNAHRVPA